MVRDPLDDLVAAPLLRYLQLKLEAPNLRYLKMPFRFHGGVENRVYGFHLQDVEASLSQPEFLPPLILRLFGQHRDATQMIRECAVQNAVADLGFPAPRVLMSEDDSSILGGPFSIMRHLPGAVAFGNTISLSNALQSWVRSCFQAPRKLAEVQASLHSLDADLVVRKMEDAGSAAATVSFRLSEIRNRIDRNAMTGLQAGMNWLLESQPRHEVRPAICHGDLWGGNLLVERSKVTGVLDWSMATLAPAEYDVAVTSMGWRYGVPDMPGVLRAFLRPAQYDAHLRYLREYRGRRRLNSELLEYFQSMRCVDVCSWVYERRLGIAGALRDDESGKNVWDVPGSTAGFESHFRRSTGVSLEMPPETTQFLY